MRVPAALVGAILAPLCGGCSFLFVHGPPANHKQLQYFDCSTSNLAPVVDTIFGASAVLGVVGVASDASQFSNLQSSARTAIAAYAVEAALFGGSAVYGYKRTSDCRAAQAELLARTPVAPPPGPVLRPGPVVDPWTGRPVAPPPP